MGASKATKNDKTFKVRARCIIASQVLPGRAQAFSSASLARLVQSRTGPLEGSVGRVGPTQVEAVLGMGGTEHALGLSALRRVAVGVGRGASTWAALEAAVFALPTAFVFLLFLGAFSACAKEERASTGQRRNCHAFSESPVLSSPSAPCRKTV